MFDSPVTVNDRTFEKWVLKSDKPVVVAFCTPKFQKCRDLEPLLDRLAGEFAGRALIARLEVDDNREWARRYSIRDLPALLFISGGTIRDRAVGLPEWDELEERTSALIERRVPRVAPKPASSPSAATSDGGPVTVTDANFQQVILSSDRPALVDFWAPWCGPCRMVAPHIETLAREMGGRAVIAKLNVDENPRTAAAYGIQGIPAMLIFRNGQPVDRIVGAQPLQVLRQRLQAAL